MKGSLNDDLQLCLGDLPTEFAAPGCLALINQITSQLPAALSSNFGFERRLGQSATGVDFLLRVEPEGCLTLMEDPGLLELRRLPAWEKTLDLISLWVQERSQPHADVTDVWLEFDTEVPMRSSMAPSVFFGVRGPASAHFSRARAERILERTLGRLVERGTLSRFLPRLMACVTSAPACVRWLEIGTMFSRPRSALRLCVGPVERDLVVPYLDRIGWAGSAGKVAYVLDSYAAYAGAVVVHLDVGGHIGSRLGLECYVTGDRDGVETGWADLLGRMVAGGLCHQNEREALLRWPGEVIDPPGDENWPEGIRKAAALLCNHRRLALRRKINHVKFNIEPSCALSAKAYLSFCRWWSALSVERPERGPLFHAAS